MAFTFASPFNHTSGIGGAKPGIQRYPHESTVEATVKRMLGAVAAAFLALALLSPPAAASCWWNGYRWHCTHHRYHHYVGYRYPYYGYYSSPYYYRPYYYGCFPIWPFCG